MTNYKGYILVIFSAILYGFFPVLCSFSYDLGNNPITLTFFRNFFAAIIIFVIMIIKGVSFRVNKQELLILTIMSSIGVLGTNLLLSTSYLYIGIGTTTTLHFLYPLIVTVFYKIRYKNKNSNMETFALLLSMLGVIMFLDFNGSKNLFGVFLAIISSLTFASYLVMMGKHEVEIMDSLKLSFYLAFITAVLLITYNLINPIMIYKQPAMSYFYMLMVALLGSFFSVILLKKGIDIIGSKKASMFLLFEPISSVFFGILILNEVPTISGLIGCLMIVGSIFCMVKAK